MLFHCIIFTKCEKFIHVYVNVDWSPPMGGGTCLCTGVMRRLFEDHVFRVLISLSNQCLGLCCSPYRVFLKIQNVSGCMNEQPVGYLMTVVSLSGGVVLQDAFLHLSYRRQRFCSMAMLVICQRGEYEIAESKVILFSQYLSSQLPSMTILILSLCGLMSELFLPRGRTLSGWPWEHLCL